MILGRRWLPKFCLLGTPLAQYRLRLRHLFRFSAQGRSRAAQRVILVCILVASFVDFLCLFEASIYLLSAGVPGSQGAWFGGIWFPAFS